MIDNAPIVYQTMGCLLWGDGLLATLTRGNLQPLWRRGGHSDVDLDDNGCGWPTPHQGW